MSMIGNYKCIQPDQLARVIEQLTSRDDPDALELYLNPHLYSDERRFDPPNPHLDIGKSWHGIHFLLNGEKWGGSPPFFDVVLGGKAIGRDHYYGPARYLTAVQVQIVSVALSSLNREELRARFNPLEFAASRIYPRGWDVEHIDEEFHWLWGNLTAVRDFFQQAVQCGDAMLLYID